MNQYRDETPDPTRDLAAAVEAMQKVPAKSREGCKCTHGPDEEDAGLCPPCYMCPECDAAWNAAMLRAALPHALRAVVEGMDEGDLGRVWAMGTGYWHSTRDMPKPVSGPATGAATGMCFPDQMRAALLAALTTAALRAAKGDSLRSSEKEE